MMAALSVDITAAFAQAYSDAARAGANMRVVVDALESIRDLAASPSGTSNIRPAFFTQIGRADLDVTAPLISRLRTVWQREEIDRIVAATAGSFAADPQRGWRTWLDAYARSFDDPSWWTELGEQLAARALPASPVPEWPPERILAAARAIRRGVWSEVLDWMLFLAAQDLRPEQRAQFLAIAAEIELFHFLRPSRTRSFLEQADAGGSADLAPEVSRVWGEYWLALNDVTQAEARFNSLVEIPDLSDGFEGLGDCYEKQGDLALAERCYQDAVDHAPGAYDAHYNVLRWSCRPEWIDKRMSTIPSLTGRLLLLSDEPSATHMDIGWLFHTASRYREAREHFREALRLDPQNSRAYIGLAHCDLDEDVPPEQKPAAVKHAGTQFAAANDLLPTVDGHVGLCRVALAEQRWDDALAQCDAAMARHPDWEPNMRTWRAVVFLTAGRLREAGAELNAALAIEPRFESAVDQLYELAEAFHAAGDRDAATAFYQSWRTNKGETAEPRFRNIIGNMAFEGGDYRTAVPHYRAAVAAAPNEPVYHRNLAGALEQVREPGQRLGELEAAIGELTQALQLTRDQQTGEAASDANSTIQEYQDRKVALEIERAFVQACGEAPLAFDLTVPPIRILLSRAVLPAVLEQTQTALSSEVLERIERFRQEVREKFGLQLPSLNFTPIVDSYDARDYVIFVNDAEIGGATFEVPVREGIRERILGTIEHTLESCLDRFVNYDMVVGLLQAHSELGKAIAANPPAVFGVAEALRSVLKEQRSIAQIDEIVTRQDRAGVPRPAGIGAQLTSSNLVFPSLVAHVQPRLSSAREAVAEAATSATEPLFDRFGVIAPALTIDDADRSGGESPRLELDHAPIGQIYLSDPRYSILTLLTGHVSELVSPGLVAYYLMRLRPRIPALVGAVLETVGDRALLAELRSRVERGASIRNLPLVLEEILASLLSAPARLTQSAQ